MADNFTSLPTDGVTDLTRAALVQALYVATQNVQSGSKALPGLAFLNDPTSGFYLYADGSAIGFVYKGSEQLTMSKAGIIFAQPATGLISAQETASQITAQGTQTLAFSALGDTAVSVTPTGPLTLSLNTDSAMAGIKQTLSVLICQPTTGGFPITISMPNVRFPKNAAGTPTPPTISANAGDDTPIEFTSYGGPDGPILGR